jgi:uncharacterized protein
MLIQALQQASCYDHPVRHFKLIETHISWILLTGDYAYKIKKPLNMGFLDFSTVEKRQFYCEEEMRLGKRMAPEIYLGVVPIRGTVQNPQLHGSLPIIEYAVKLHEFPQKALLSEKLKQQELSPALIRQLAKQLADFHQSTTVAPLESRFGSPEQVHAPVIQNFEQIKPLLSSNKAQEKLAKLYNWSMQQWRQKQSVFSDRKQKGFIRECHGDLHLANILAYKDKIILFDCLEFNEDFRWTDVMADVAFLIMDLSNKGQPELANLLLNEYVSLTQDYTGLSLLPYYVVYRAMVRAKVSLFRLQQTGLRLEEKQQCLAEYDCFIGLAENTSNPTAPQLAITHGPSGSGKTTLAKQWAMTYRAIHLRSDVVRKQLYHLPLDTQAYSPVYGNYYSPEATERTYQTLLIFSEKILQAGYSVIVDAAFLIKNQRKLFYELTQQYKIVFSILSSGKQPTLALLKTRIQSRQCIQEDISEARAEDILPAQIKQLEPLDEEEKKRVVFFDSLLNS